MPKPLSHFHVWWWDSNNSPDAHLLCLTAQGKQDAEAEARRYLGDSLGSIEMITRKGNAASYATCRAPSYSLPEDRES